MQTKYNVGDTVLVEAEILKIEITKKSTTYKLRIIDKNNIGYITVDLRENDIAMLLVDINKEETDERCTTNLPRI